MEGIVGIDYGSKLAGTTVIAYNNGFDKRIHLFQSQKNKCADSFILDKLSDLNCTTIGIDAPLSLPGVYTGIQGCSDFHYRKCDQETNAMSPMFLGGLTARAMKLKSQLTPRVIEVYPKQVAVTFDLHEHGYKKTLSSIPMCLRELFKPSRFPFEVFQCENWHQFDAILALVASYRFQRNMAESIGDVNEGIIYF